MISFLPILLLAAAGTLILGVVWAVVTVLVLGRRGKSHSPATAEERSAADE